LPKGVIFGGVYFTESGEAAYVHLPLFAHTLKLPFNGFLLLWSMRKLTGKMLAH